MFLITDDAFEDKNGTTFIDEDEVEELTCSEISN
jgi:hypothetical protein